MKVLSEQEITAIEESAAQEVDAAIAKARTESEPNPYDETWEALSTHSLVEGLGEDR